VNCGVHVLYYFPYRSPLFPKVKAVLFHLVFLCLYREFISVFTKRYSLVAQQSESVHCWN